MTLHENHGLPLSIPDNQENQLVLSVDTEMANGPAQEDVETAEWLLNPETEELLQDAVRRLGSVEGALKDHLQPAARLIAAAQAISESGQKLSAGGINAQDFHLSIQEHFEGIGQHSLSETVLLYDIRELDSVRDSMLESDPPSHQEKAQKEDLELAEEELYKLSQSLQLAGLHLRENDQSVFELAVLARSAVPSELEDHSGTGISALIKRLKAYELQSIPTIVEVGRLLRDSASELAQLADHLNGRLDSRAQQSISNQV